jgi:hypothetical protein
MSQKQLVAAIDERFRALNQQERITRIRELAGESAEDERFIRKTFPALYREAFPANGRAKNRD